MKKMLDMIATKSVAIYTRVSTPEQAKEGYSLPAQEKVLVNFCNAKKITKYTRFIKKWVYQLKIYHIDPF